MKKAIFIILLNLLGFVSSAQVYSSFELENLSNYSSEDYFKPQINIFSSSLKEQSKMGFYYFALLNENYGQIYGGAVLKLSPQIVAYIGAGLETNKNPYRYNFGVEWSKGKINFIQVYEYGGSGFWHNILLNYELSESNLIGLIFKRYYGAGVSFEKKFKKVPLRMFFSPLYDYEDKCYKSLISIKYRL